MVNLASAQILGLPWWAWLLLGGGVIALGWLIRKAMSGQAELKIPRISLKVLAKEEREEIFKETAPYEFDKTLRCGPENYGEIREMFYYKVSQMPKGLKGKFKFKRAAILIGYVTTKGKFSNILYFLGKGLKYYLIEHEKILNEDGHHVYINPFSQRDKLLGFNIFSELGYAVVENIIYKRIHEQHLEELLNFVPKSTILEVERAKDSATLTEVGKMAKLKSNEIIEQIRKGK